MNTIRPIVFFDGSCPLCRREMNHYRRIDRSGSIQWVDISSDVETLKSYDIPFDWAMRILHAVNKSGQVVVGVSAFVLIWGYLDYYKHLAKIVQFFKLEKVLNYFYQHFARWRYQKRCKGGCSIPS